MVDQNKNNSLPKNGQFTPKKSRNFATMNYLYAVNLSKAYGDQFLFSDVSISINKGQKVALIARNGSGKTSLLRMIARLESPDSGQIEIHPNIRIGFLTQETRLDPETTIQECIYLNDNPQVAAIREYDNCLLEQSKGSTPELEEKLQALMDKMDQLKAWDYEARIKEILHRLDISNLQQKVGTLSGGQRKRIALASILIQEPDFFILDEPTNHLDIGMIEWLEEYLTTKNATLLLVTHDRYFLDKVSEEIIEIDNGVSYKYKGGYSYFLEKKAEREYNKRQEVDNAQKLMKKELEWMRRQPKARGTKAKSRVESFYDIEKTAKQKTDKEDAKLAVKGVYIGKKIVEFANVYKSFGEEPNVVKILHEFSYNFKRYDRVGIVGNNGTGKTTFIKMILGEEKQTAGTIEVGATLEFGYFKQELNNLDENMRVIEVVRDIAEHVVMSDKQKLSAVQLLHRFLFPSDTHRKYVSVLSGGEKRRLHLLTILMKSPNFLILDEPTNDLDLATLNVLEDFLSHFSGVLIVVTHDRYFMDKLVDHVLVFEGNGKVRDFPGNYTQYRLKQAAEQKAERAAKAEAKAEAKIAAKEEAQNTPTTVKADSQKPKKKLSYKEQEEFKKLEPEMEKLEAQKAELEAQLGSGKLDGTQIMELSKELATVVGSLEEKENRWLELSEFV